MHPFSVLTLGIFVAGYITARWDLVTRLYELAIFAWDHGVVVSSMCDSMVLPELFFNPMYTGAYRERLPNTIGVLFPLHHTHRTYCSEGDGDCEFLGARRATTPADFVSSILGPNKEASPLENNCDVEDPSE